MLTAFSFQNFFSLFHSFGFPVVCLLLAGNGVKGYGGNFYSRVKWYTSMSCVPFFSNSSSQPFFSSFFSLALAGEFLEFRLLFRFVSLETCNLQLAWEILNMHTLNAVDCGIRDCNCSRSCYCCCLCSFLYVVIGEHRGYIISNEVHIKKQHFCFSSWQR